MKKIKEWAYLLFRPKWERRLYKLLKNASLDKNLCLGTVLYDYCSSEKEEGKFFKAGIDAMFIGWIGCFNTKISARKLYALQAQNVVIGLEPLPDGSAPDVATHEAVVLNSPLKEYLKHMARYIESDEVLDCNRHYLKSLSETDFLGLTGVWQKRQKAACQMVRLLVEKEIKAEELYIDDFNGADYKEQQNIKLCFRHIIDIKASRATSSFPDNWATLVAYYCSYA